MTAREISKLPFFIQECKRLDVTPTVRQARKCRQGSGRWANNPLTACVNNVHAEAA